MKKLVLLLVSTLCFSALIFPVPVREKKDMQETKDNLYNHVLALTQIKPPRNYKNISSLNKAADYISKKFTGYSLKVSIQKFEIDGKVYKNIITTYGEPDLPRIVIGAHYDVCGDQAGADDNASGIAGLLELARLVATKKPPLKYRLDFVAYTLEEPPYYATEAMGSFVHAKSLYDNDAEVRLMVAIEMIGYYSNEAGSQKYPNPLLNLIYPGKGNYIAVVGRPGDRQFIH